jgi:hypothetical protein
MSQGYLFGNRTSGDASRPTGQYYQIGRVKSIVLGPKIPGSNNPDPDYKSSADIGKIKYELLYSPLATSVSDNVSEAAYPIFGFLKQYPLIGEIVLVMTGPSPGLNDKFSKQQYFYFPPYALWGDTHHNAFPNLSEFGKFVNTYASSPGNVPVENSEVKFPLGANFTEKDNIKNLQPFEGDTILQSRFGQSIRFGSTNTADRTINNWSNSGDNGDPITIILNQQNTNDYSSKFDPTVENINRDGSAIYMTSTQEIFLEDINAFPLNSFGVGTDIVSQPVYSTNKLPISNAKISAEEQDKNSIGG